MVVLILSELLQRSDMSFTADGYHRGMIFFPIGLSILASIVLSVVLTIIVNLIF